MAEVKVPELAESITEGTIAEWLKQVGDTVEKGEAILELETDKVNVEVVSEEEGTIQELLAEEGDTVEVGQAIAIVGEGGLLHLQVMIQKLTQKTRQINQNKKRQTNKSRKKKNHLLTKKAKAVLQTNALMQHLQHVARHVKKALA